MSNDLASYRRYRDYLLKGSTDGTARQLSSYYGPATGPGGSTPSLPPVSGPTYYQGGTPEEKYYALLRANYSPQRASEATGYVPVISTRPNPNATKAWADWARTHPNVANPAVTAVATPSGTVGSPGVASPPGNPTTAWTQWAASQTTPGAAAVRTTAQTINRNRMAANVQPTAPAVFQGATGTYTPNYQYDMPTHVSNPVTGVAMPVSQPVIAAAPAASVNNPANVQGSVIVGPGATQPGVTYLNLAQFQQLANLAAGMAANNQQGPGPAYGQYSAPGVTMQTPAQAVATAAYNIGSNPYNVGQNTKENYDFLLKLLQEQVAANAPYTGSPV